MKSRISLVIALGLVCGIGAFSWAGCSEDEGGSPAPAKDTGGGGGVCDEPTDIENPPIACGPEGGGAPACSSTDKVGTCPNNACMYRTEQTGPTKNFRMGRIRLWAPSSLMNLAAIAVDPNVNARCANSGSESFTWLMQVDTAAKTLRTGGSRGSTDDTTFAFLEESVDASKVEGICPGFVGPKDPVDLRPVTTTYTETDGAFTTPKMALINVPIFDSSGVPIILPLREAMLKSVKMDGSCVGKYEKKYWCDGDSLGWTTGGAIIAKITAEDADRVPVKSAGCQSLCAILVNDSTKTEGKVCKRGPDGKVPEIGTTCLGGTGCKNAFQLSATFGAYGVTITTSAPADAGTDTGGGDTGGSSDAADGG
ncbi:MAG: hypothetical protein HYV09_01540 [Deltaproteobacteria bacterium]|nr:hypothetical protein [Deltaproteobacteria bacterium]